MNGNTEHELIRRTLAHLPNGSDMVEHVSRRSVQHYLSPDRFAAEQRVLFGQRPRVVAHSSQLPKPGDYLSVDGGGVPLLLVRQPDGDVRGFFNVCRHRGRRLVDAPCGNAMGAFVCPYHAWSYGGDGRLISMRQPDGFPDVDAGERGLARVPTVERHGLLWVQPSGGELDVDAYLGGLGEDLATLRLDSHHVYRPTVHRKAMNWKLAFDVFLESYHLRFTHKDTIYPLFFDNVGLYDRIGVHQRNLFPKRSIAELADADESTWSLRPHANILYTLFPNTLLLVQPDHVSMFQAYPDGIDRCIVSSCTLTPDKATSHDAKRYWDKNIAVLHAAIEEDFEMGESIQQGLASGANDELLFGRYEQALAWFHASVDDALKAPAS